MHNPAGRSLQPHCFPDVWQDRQAHRNTKELREPVRQTLQACWLALFKRWGLSMAVKWLRTKKNWRVCPSLIKFCPWNTDTFPAIWLDGPNGCGMIWLNVYWCPQTLRTSLSCTSSKSSWGPGWGSAPPLPPLAHFEPWIKSEWSPSRPCSGHPPPGLLLCTHPWLTLDWWKTSKRKTDSVVRFTLSRNL